MGTRAAGGYVGMSEGWLGTVCALFLRSFNKGVLALKNILMCAPISSLKQCRISASHTTVPSTAQPPPPRGPPQTRHQARRARVKRLKYTNRATLA